MTFCLWQCIFFIFFLFRFSRWTLDMYCLWNWVDILKHSTCHVMTTRRRIDWTNVRIRQSLTSSDRLSCESFVWFCNVLSEFYPARCDGVQQIMNMRCADNYIYKTYKLEILSAEFQCWGRWGPAGLLKFQGELLFVLFWKKIKPSNGTTIVTMA